MIRSHAMLKAVAVIVMNIVEGMAIVVQTNIQVGFLLINFGTIIIIILVGRGVRMKRVYDCSLLFESEIINKQHAARHHHTKKVYNC